MAIRNDPRLYTSGGVLFDSSPYTDFTVNLLAKKQAQNEAIDNYFMKMNESINPEGMREKDMPEFQKKIENLKVFTLQNKDKLRKGDIPTQMAREKLFRDAQQHVFKSKEATGGFKDFMGVTQKLREEDSDTEPAIKEYQFNELPVSDPNYKRFNAAPFLMAPKPFNETAYFSKFKDIPRMEETLLGRVDPKTGMRIDTYVKRLNPETKNALAAQFAQDYNTLNSFGNRVRSAIKNPEEQKLLADTFRNEFGREPESGEDYAAAYGMRRIQPEITEQGRPVRDEKWMADYRNAQERAMKQWERSIKAGDETQAGKWFDVYLDSKKEMAKTGPKGVQLAGGVGWEIPLDVNMRKIFTIEVEGKKVEPDKLVLTEDEKYVPIFYAYDDKNQVEMKKSGFPVVDYSLSIPHTQEDVKVAMGGKAGVKQMNIEMKGVKKSEPSKGTYNIKGKTYSEKELLDMGYTLDQIKPYRK